MNAIQYDVVVIGGGVVGATTAIALQKAGFSTAMIERGCRPEPFATSKKYDARVYAISPASKEMLARVGIWSGIAALRASAFGTMHVWVDQSDARLSFSAADVGRGELGWIVEHGVILDRLWDGLDSVDVYASSEIQGVDFGGYGHQSRVALADGKTLHPSLLVGADGADSGLRHLAGIDTVGRRYPQKAIVCHVRTARPHLQAAWQRFLPSGPLAFLPLADGRSSIVWSAHLSLADELVSLDERGFCQRLRRAIGGVFGEILEATPRLAVPLRVQQAKNYVQDGLVLIGDAAHTMHPLAGQGVNMGLADVGVLVNTIAEARLAGRDWKGHRSLRRYERIRRAENTEMLMVTDSLYRLFDARLPGLRTILGIGMDGINLLSPAREWLVERAIGA